MKIMTTLAVALLVTVLACADRTDTVPADATEERPTTTADDIAAVDPDTVAWIQRGDVLEWGGRRWILAGEPIRDPILSYVGTAEGMDLYATPERMPSEQIFFHLGGGRWQMLEAVDPAGTGADTIGADTSAAGAAPGGTGGSPR